MTPAPTHPVDILHAAADLLEKNAATAPTGPYTMDTRRTPDDTRLLFAGDGDAFAVATDWAGGHGHDTGTPEQIAAHLTVWTPEVARTVAAWLRATAAMLARHPTDLGRIRFGPSHEPALAVARALLAAKDRT